jgi:TRAP-type mannitol/chloroaromatic compound transport system permease small subunit
LLEEQSVVRGLVRLIERVSWVCGVLAGLSVLALIGVMMVEVFARYVLGKPTLWAFDVAYMLNGAAFLLACGLALRVGRVARRTRPTAGVASRAHRRRPSRGRSDAATQAG